MQTAPAKNPSPTPFVQPIGTGVAAFTAAAAIHLLLPLSGRVRINGSGAAWLDPYRVGPEVGWLAYLGYCFAEALVLGLLVGVTHSLILRLFSRGWIKCCIGWFFVAAALILGVWLPLFLHRFPRVWIETN